MKELEKLRVCGRLETYSTARHHLGYYNNVGLTATYTSALLSPQSFEPLIYAALKSVIAQHPNLSAIALNEDKSYPDVYFARLPSIDLRSCVEFHERKGPMPGDGEADEELNQILTEQHARNYKDNLGLKPFWRLAVLTSLADKTTFTAAWVFHHALADGSSAFLFHETFLAALNSLDSIPDTEPVVKSPTNDLPPPFEDLHPMPISWPFFLTTIAKILFPSVFHKRLAKLWTGNAIPSSILLPPKLKFRAIVFSADVTHRLAQVSRQKGVSVTATLQCLLASSLFVALPADEFDKIKITGPMAARRFLAGLEDAQMTNALMQWDFTHNRPLSVQNEEKTANALRYFSWDEAQSVKSTIQSVLAQAGRDNSIALLKYVSNMHSFFTDQQGKQRASSAELSNIGVYKPKGEGMWQIGRMTFSQCANPTSGAFGVSVVTGGDGCASLNFSWCEDAMEEGLLEKVVEGVRDGVRDLVTRGG